MPCNLNRDLLQARESLDANGEQIQELLTWGLAFLKGQLKMFDVSEIRKWGVQVAEKLEELFS
jgi:hypothetical protein